MIFQVFSFAFLFFYYSNLSANTSCQIMANRAEQTCLMGVTTTNPGALEMQKAACKNQWSSAYNECVKSAAGSNNKEKNVNCNPLLRDCSDTSTNSVRNVPTLDTNGTTNAGESCLQTCMKSFGKSQYCQAQCSGSSSDNPNSNVDDIYNPTRSDDSNANGSQPGDPNNNTNTVIDENGNPVNENPNSVSQPVVVIPEPFIDIPSYENELNQCYDKLDSANLCCTSSGSEACLQQSSEGATMISDLTNAYSIAKSSGGGLRDHCSSVKTLQQKNIAVTAYAKTLCDSKSSSCKNDCDSLLKKLSVEYSSQCSNLPSHWVCQEASKIMKFARSSSGSCSELSSAPEFTLNLAQNAAGLKVAKDCEEQLKNFEGNSFASMPFPTDSNTTTNVDCTNTANSGHPSCQIQSQAQNTQSPTTSGKISNGSDSPDWYNEKTGEFEDPELLAQQQFEEKMKSFQEGSAKLDSQMALAKGSSSGGVGLGFGNGSGSGSDALDPMPSTTSAPDFESNLFKSAGSRKGWSSSGGKFRTPSSESGKISFSSFMKNEKLPTKIKHPWVGMNIRDFMNDSHRSDGSSLIHQGKWLFGVNSNFQYTLFKNGEHPLLSAQTMQRIKPSEDFIGMSHLKAHHKASLKLHCALKNDPFLDLNLPNQRLKTVSQNMVNFTHFNLNNRLPCSNRDLNKGNFQILKQPDVVTFKRGEVFETNHFKIVLDAEFRGDEKPPVWLFTNKTNEIFFTFTGKIRDPKIDTLEVYKYYLDNPIPFKDLSGVDNESQPIKVQYQMIAGHKWVDALHYNSEKKGYFTRYLATIYKDKAYLFTFNVHKSYYLKYSDKIAKMISSIRLDGTNPNIKYRDEALRRNYLAQTKSTPTGDGISALYDENLRSVNSVEIQKFNPIYFYLGIILVLSSGVYFWISRRKYKKKHTE